MDCVILFRNTDNGTIGFVSDGDKIRVYRHHDYAVADVPNIPILQAFPYQIVEMDEL